MVSRCPGYLPRLLDTIDSDDSDDDFDSYIHVGAGYSMQSTTDLHYDTQFQALTGPRQ